MPECQSDGVTGLTCDHLHCPRSSDESLRVSPVSLSQGIKVSGSLQGPGPELSTSQPANPGLAPATRHTLNTALWPSLGDHLDKKRFFRVF